MSDQPITPGRILRITLYVVLFLFVFGMSTIVIFYSPLPLCHLGLMDCWGVGFIMMFVAPPLGCCLSPILFAVLYNMIQYVINQRPKQKRKRKEF